MKSSAYRTMIISPAASRSPALSVEVEHVVQIDVGQAAARSPPLVPSPSLMVTTPSSENARLEPFLDQADDAPVADPVLQELDQPFLAHRG